MEQPLLKRQLALFFSLYTTQFIGVGFMFVALIGILRQDGADLDDLSIVYLTGLPWMLKFAWAPLIDRFGYAKWGHYRGWLLVLQLLMVIALLILGQLSLEKQLTLVVIIGALFVALSASQDVAVDALASREFDKQHRGIVNGIQMAGGMLGNIIGGGIILILYQYIGWQGAFYLMAGVTSISWLQLLFFDEQCSRPSGKPLSLPQTFKHMILFWRGKGLWFMLIAIGAMGYSMIYAILTPMMLDAGKTLSDVGFVINIFGAGVGIFSGLLAGKLIQRLGRKISLKRFYISQVICFIAILPVVFVMNNFTLYFSLIVYFIIYPFIVTVMATLMMDYASQESSPGSDYTVQFTLSFFSGMIMSGLSMQIAQHFGYLGVMIIAIVMSIIALILALAYAKKIPQAIEVEH